MATGQSRARRRHDRCLHRRPVSPHAPARLRAQHGRPPGNDGPRLWPRLRPLRHRPRRRGRRPRWRAPSPALARRLLRHPLRPSSVHREDLRGRHDHACRAAASGLARGWQEFTLKDEPYINNYFGPDGNQPAPNVTIFATSMLPNGSAPARGRLLGHRTPGRRTGIWHRHAAFLSELEKRRPPPVHPERHRLDRQTGSAPPKAWPPRRPILAEFQPAALEPKPAAPKP